MALRFAFASLCFDRAWNWMKFGMAIAARMPMIATTIISSIRVKPLCRKRFIWSPFPWALYAPQRTDLGGRGARGVPRRTACFQAFAELLLQNYDRKCRSADKTCQRTRLWIRAHPGSGSRLGKKKAGVAPPA